MTANMKHDAKSKRAVLREQLREYKGIIGNLTADEKKDLHQWVAGGNSVYENPYFLYDESGNPMDFISSRRVDIDMCENPSHFFWGEPAIVFRGDCNAEDGPF